MLSTVRKDIQISFQIVVEQLDSQRELIGVVLRHYSFIAAVPKYFRLEQNLKNTPAILIRDRLVEE